MSTAFVDGDWTSAKACSLPVFEFPIEGVASPYVLKQDFMMLKSSFTPLSLNTAHPDDSSYKFVHEGPLQDIGGGGVKWTRTYAQTPSQHIEMSTVNYNFIGFWGLQPPTTGSSIVNPLTYYGRPRRVHLAKVKHQFDYYNVPSDASTIYDIPIIEETKYLSSNTIFGPSTIEVDFLWDYVTPDGRTHFLAPSNPSRSTYEGWIAADKATANSFSIVSQGSRIERWMGNIFRRETLYIKAI
jgi:hypothetical protein